MSYLTPQRFRDLGLGVDLSSRDDAELAPILSQASALADSYCLVPRLPQKHDFRGGTITKEEHAWRYPTTPFEVGQRRYYFWHWPVKSISQFRIYVTNTQYVEIAPTELMINNSERYFEVVSLAITSSGLFNALVVPNVGLATPLARCSYEYGFDFEIVDEELYCTDGQTWRAQNQYWFSDAERTPVVKINGVVQTTGYTVDYNEGTVVFDEQLTTSDRVSASYHHKLPWEIQHAVGHFAAMLIGKSEVFSRGLSHLTRIRIAEMELERHDPNHRVIIEDIESMAPEACELLRAYRADSITVR